MDHTQSTPPPEDEAEKTTRIHPFDLGNDALPGWAREGRVAPNGPILTIPNLSVAAPDNVHATWLRIDCLECRAYTEWVFTAEDGNGWDIDHRHQTGHRQFYSWTLTRISYAVEPAEVAE